MVYEIKEPDWKLLRRLHRVALERFCRRVIEEISAATSDRRKRTRSLREKSGRKPGGQEGHPGTTLGFVERPDHLVINDPQCCYLCGSSLAGIEAARTERRQVHDLPPQKLEVTEHRAQTKVCRRCGAENKGEFPAGIKAPVQYGAGVKSVAAYLLGYQLLPYDRCAEAMNDLFGCHVSPGTLATLLEGCAGGLAGAELLIKEGLRKSAVLGVDETGLRVSQRQDWVHVTSTEDLTLLAHDRRRGERATTGIDILPRFEGVVVHDGFSSYDQVARGLHAGLLEAYVADQLAVRAVSREDEIGVHDYAAGLEGLRTVITVDRGGFGDWLWTRHFALSLCGSAPLDFARTA